MQTDTGIAATELQGDAAKAVMVDAMAGDLTLQPMEESAQQRVDRVLGPKVGDDAWAKVRRDVHRELNADLNSRVTNNLGLWT